MSAASTTSGWVRAGTWVGTQRPSQFPSLQPYCSEPASGRNHIPQYPSRNDACTGLPGSSHLEVCNRMDQWYKFAGFADAPRMYSQDRPSPGGTWRARILPPNGPLHRHVGLHRSCCVGSTQAHEKNTMGVRACCRRLAGWRPRPFQLFLRGADLAHESCANAYCVVSDKAYSGVG